MSAEKLTKAEEIAALNARVAALEAQVAMLAARPIYYPTYPSPWPYSNQPVVTYSVRPQP